MDQEVVIEDIQSKIQYIYLLSDPDGTPRYIGKTMYPERRFKNHLQPNYLEDNTYRSRWIKTLLTKGMKPLFSIIKESDYDHWIEDEKEAIAYYRAQGYPLTNLTDGGEGFVGYKFTDEVKARIAASNTGKKRSPEFCQMMSTVRKGKPVPKLQGRTIGPEWRERMAEAKRGTHRSEETKAKISASMKGKAPNNKGKTYVSPKQSEILTGKPSRNKGKKLSIERRMLVTELKARNKTMKMLNILCPFIG